MGESHATAAGAKGELMLSPKPLKYTFPAELVEQWRAYTLKCQTPGEGDELVELVSAIDAHRRAQDVAWAAKHDQAVKLVAEANKSKSPPSASE